ncbi:MAG: tRNA pseudouridine(13) synthase TruD [Candidatus Altiarchaeales archaeon ex4484_43]|nr:MAG: tRNA pseudouridine(13) synthase TruD [Candidatus Altiarchaeales archaeon ex4484_43]
MKIKPPALEYSVGMELYKSNTEGIGGKIKQIPEDFLVEEIMPDGRVLELDKGVRFNEGERREYLHFTLQKYNWDTIRAIRVISNRLNVGKKRFGFAGTKDKRALTTQRVSVWNVSPEELRRVRIKDMTLRDFSYSDERITLGDLRGNRFTIVIRNLGLDDGTLRERINSVLNELNGEIPNFFGVQRFGTIRPITHLVGREILKRNFKGAVMTYLADIYGGESEESREARKFLSETEDFQEALRRFPKHLGYELAMLNSLAKTPTDFIGALRRLPKKLRWMFVHAYQAYVFNKALSRYIREGAETEKLPLAGYEIKLDEITSRILESEKISQENFKISEMPELSSGGVYRDCFMDVKGFEILDIDKDELSEGKKKVTIRFSLSKGCYTTTVLREMMKNEYW